MLLYLKAFLNSKAVDEFEKQQRIFTRDAFVRAFRTNHGVDKQEALLALCLASDAGFADADCDLCLDEEYKFTRYFLEYLHRNRCAVNRSVNVLGHEFRSRSPRDVKHEDDEVDESDDLETVVIIDKKRRPKARVRQVTKTTTAPQPHDEPQTLKIIDGVVIPKSRKRVAN